MSSYDFFTFLFQNVVALKNIMKGKRKRETGKLAERGDSQGSASKSNKNEDADMDEESFPHSDEESLVLISPVALLRNYWEGCVS